MEGFDPGHPDNQAPLAQSEEHKLAQGLPHVSIKNILPYPSIIVLNLINSVIIQNVVIYFLLWSDIAWFKDALYLFSQTCWDIQE